MQTGNKTNTLVKLGMLAALGVVLMLATRFSIIPSAPFLKYDAGDVAALVAGFVFGPLYGLCVVVVTAIIQTISVDQDAGLIGMFAHIAATGVFVVISAIIYKKFHTIGGALVALLTGAICMSVVMIFMNLFVFLPLYLPGSSPTTIWTYITTAIIPFNLIKGILNSILTFAIYKASSRYLAKEALLFRKSKNQ